jgi:predicted enzyme related to lactoylglutathione lyase
MKIGIRSPGEFCWINILTPGPDEARSFFGSLLGWTFTPVPGLGHRIEVGGHQIGGLFDINAPRTPPGAHPTIGVMIKVENADRACERVKSLGGAAKPAFNIADQLRMAVCHDRTGAEFDLWESKSAHGSEVSTHFYGAPTFFECVTTDVDQAAEFYTELFGWTARDGLTPRGRYVVFELSGADIAGMHEIRPEMGSMHPHWRTCFAVESAASAAEKALQLGGSISIQLRESGNGGAFCGITSPQGLSFMVANSASKQSPP